MVHLLNTKSSVTLCATPTRTGFHLFHLLTPHSPINELENDDTGLLRSMYRTL